MFGCLLQMLFPEMCTSESRSFRLFHVDDALPIFLTFKNLSLIYLGCKNCNSTFVRKNNEYSSNFITRGGENAVNSHFGCLLLRAKI